MKQTFILTQSNSTETIGAPVAQGEAISIRGAFLKGTGLGLDGANMKAVNFKHVDSLNGSFNVSFVNDNQTNCNPDNFNYELKSGVEIVVEATGLEADQKIYVEVLYELLSL